MLITKKYQCQSCFKLNEIDIELTYCSETTDLIEDMIIYAVILILFLILPKTKKIL